MSSGIRRSRSHAVQAAVAVSALLLLGTLYVGLMRATVRLSQLDAEHSASNRDGMYFYLHTGVLLLGALSGFGLGKWLNGLGIAYAVLFVVALAVVMVMAHLGSYTLACQGHNDLIRHWTC